MNFNWEGTVTPEMDRAVKSNLNLILRALNQKETR
jgi:hypothetical protein